MIGYLLLLASLAMDGFTGPFQERLLAQYQMKSEMEMMFHVNLWSSLYLLGGSLCCPFSSLVVTSFDRTIFISLWTIALVASSSVCFRNNLVTVFLVYIERSLRLKLVLIRPLLSEEHVKFYASEVLLALEYLHSLGFIYRGI